MTGISYGKISLTEFIQPFPERIGLVITDGVIDPKVDAETYIDPFRWELLPRVS